MLRTLALCCVVILATVRAALAQTGQADITPFGDWKSGKRGEIKATALNDPGINLNVLCSGDVIEYELDPPLSGLSSDVNKPVYIMTDRTAPAFEKTDGWLVHGKTGLTVHADRRWFKDADSVTFCPVEDVTNAACRTFSLRGYAAAQDATCVKWPKEKFEDWTASEYSHGDHAAFGVPDQASTESLNVPDTVLTVICGNGDGYYTLDRPLSGNLPEMDGKTFVYIMTNRTAPAFDKRVAELAGEGDSLGFRANTQSFIKGGSVTICAVADEKHESCRTFSLRGFTAARKEICLSEERRDALNRDQQ